jgi:hypothetical protein
LIAWPRVRLLANYYGLAPAAFLIARPLFRLLAKYYGLTPAAFLIAPPLFRLLAKYYGLTPAAFAIGLCGGVSILRGSHVVKATREYRVLRASAEDVITFDR